MLQKVRAEFEAWGGQYHLITLCLMLLVAGCSRSSDPRRDFVLAAKRGDVKRATSILAARPALATVPVSDGITLLHWSAFEWSDDVTTALIKAGAKVNALDAKGKTPLGFAVDAKRPSSTVRLLLKSGASPNLVARDRLSPLYVAVLDRNCAVVKLLVEHGADVNYSYKGVSLLKTARLSCPKLVPYLQAHGARLRADER